MATFPFVSLPREIRDQIYAFVLNIRQAKVIDPPSDEKQILEKYQHVCHNEYYSSVCASKKLAPAPDISLLCCSRLINAEVLEARRRRNNTVYELDLLCDEHRLFANWMALPVPISQASAVEIDVRMTESCNLPQQPYCPISRMVRANLGLVIYRFLYHGASFRDPNEGTNPPRKCRLLRRIVLNFYPPMNEDGTPTYKPTMESFGHIFNDLFDPQEITMVIRCNGQSEETSSKIRVRVQDDMDESGTC